MLRLLLSGKNNFNGFLTETCKKLGIRYMYYNKLTAQWTDSAVLKFLVGNAATQ